MEYPRPTNNLIATLRGLPDRVIAELPYWDKFGTGRFTVWAYAPPAARPRQRPARPRQRRVHR